MTETTTRLHRLVIEGVAGVDLPANYVQTGGKAGWIVMKAATLDADLDKAKGTACSESGCTELVKDGEDECPAGHKQKAEAKKAAAKPQTPEEIAKAAAAGDPAVAAALDAIRKDADDRVAKAQETATAALKAAEAERDVRLTAEWVAKADEFIGLAVSPDEFGPVLRACSDALKAEHFDLLTKALRAGLAASRLTAAPAGRTIAVKAGSAYEQLDAMAKERAVKDGISKAAALEIVTNEHPELAARYIQER